MTDQPAGPAAGSARPGPLPPVTRWVEAGALIKFARATGESAAVLAAMQAAHSRGEALIAPLTYVSTFCDALTDLFQPHPDYNMFLHTADTVVNYEPIRSGDAITASAELTGELHKVGSRGPTLVQTGLITLTNQHGRRAATVEVEMRSFRTLAVEADHA